MNRSRSGSDSRSLVFNMGCRRCTKKKIKKPKVKVNRGIVNPRKIEGPRDRRARKAGRCCGK